MHAACTQTRTGRGTMHRESEARTCDVYVCSGDEGGGVGARREKGRRRVRCSIGHYLRRVTGSVVTAPRFAHRLPVLQRSPTPSRSSFPSAPHSPPRSSMDALCSSRPFPIEPSPSPFHCSFCPPPRAPRRSSTVSPLRNLPRDSRSGHRRLDLGIRAAAVRKTSALFSTVSRRRDAFHGSRTRSLLNETTGDHYCEEGLRSLGHPRWGRFVPSFNRVIGGIWKVITIAIDYMELRLLRIFCGWCRHRVEE